MNAVPPSHEPGSPLSAGDLAVCQSLLANGSRSFSIASWLLPTRVREPTAAFYAFCRVADDLVDEGEPMRGVDSLRRRIDGVFTDRRLDDPVDRALASVIESAKIPRAVLDTLLEGFAWDAQLRRYRSFDELHEYGVRVASTVGVVMAMIMGRRDRGSLARACDLGAAMQLTNIARDVGEDARRGRIYLPLACLEQQGLDVDAWLAEPCASQSIRTVTLGLLEEADWLYERAASGISALPADCRPAIRAAASIYRDIGRVIRARAGDSVTTRARVGGLRKLWLLARASRTPDVCQGFDRPPIPAAQALVDATVWAAS